MQQTKDSLRLALVSLSASLLYPSRRLVEHNNKVEVEHNNKVLPQEAETQRLIQDETNKLGKQKNKTRVP